MTSEKQWNNELLKIAAIIGKAPLEKTIKWGSEVFTYNGKNVISYGGFKNYCALWFYNGVFLKDKYKVLVNAQENKTKSLRQWRFTCFEEIDEQKITEYITEAMEIEKRGLKIPPEKFTPLPLPQILTNAFREDKSLLAAFEKLTPGRQKEYIVFINEAKQDETKRKRLEKIKPMIINGIGLNDKYK